MASGTFLKNLLGELSLDRAMIQILDQPYLQDLATRLKQNEAVGEIMKKLDKDEGVYGWMDYDQLMQLREIILPEMLMKHSELESPSPKIGGELGETFDDQFQSIFGKKKLARGGITSLSEGGPYGDVLEYINLLDKEGKKFPVPWDKLDEEYQDAWTEAIKKKHREEHYSDTEHGWDVLGFTAQPDYIAQPYKRYWNEEEGYYQKEPYSPEQIEGESWWDKQRRIGGRLEPYGFDMGEWAKLTGKDELAWAKGLLQSATPGTGGIPGFWGALANPIGDYIENWEDYASQTGDYPKWYEQMGSSLGVGIPAWMGIGWLGSKLPKGYQSVLKELFPLTFDKAFGKGAGTNWYKSMIRNPLNIMRTHVDPWFNKRMIQQGITKLAPRLAAKGPLGAAGPLGWAAALGLGAYDVYSVYKWLQDNSAEEMEELIPENE
jgi:hypothetical protein